MIEDGDLIEIDLESKRISLLVPSDVLDSRRMNFKRKEKKVSGVMESYRDRVLSADKGALWL